MCTVFALCIFSIFEYINLCFVRRIQIQSLIDFGLVRVCTVRFRLKVGVISEHRSLKNSKLLKTERLL